MIRSVTFQPPHYATKLPCIGTRTFAFPVGPSLTYLFGPNGVGKSTLLMGMAVGSAAEGGGWSKCPDPSRWYRPRSQHLGSTEELAATAEVLSQFGGCVVDWDGTASLFVSSDRSDATPDWIGEATDGLDKNDDDAMFAQLGRLMGHSSSGQHRISRIVKLLRTVRMPPDLLVPRFQKDNNLWSSAGVKFATHVQVLRPTSVVTLLLDEPDRSLSIPNCAELHQRILPELAKRCQVIVATHSPFALGNWQPERPDQPSPAILFDLQEGYAVECLRAIESIKVQP